MKPFLKKKNCKKCTDFLVKRSDPDPVQFFRTRMAGKFLFRPDPDPQRFV